MERMSNINKAKFGCFQHYRRNAAVVAFERVKKINRDNEAAKLKKDKKRELSSQRSENSDSESDEDFQPISASSSGQQQQQQQRVAWSSQGRVTIGSKFGIGPNNLKDQAKKMSGGQNGDCSSESGGSQQSQRGPATPKKKGRPFGSKVKEEDSKDNILDAPRLPEHIKIAIQVMLSTCNGTRGLNVALVEKQFQDVYPELSDFNPSDYGFLSFKNMLASPQMETHVCHSRVQQQHTYYGHPLSTTQGKLKWDSENRSFSITLNEGNSIPPSTITKPLPETSSPEKRNQELPMEQQLQLPTAAVQAVPATLQQIVPRGIPVVSVGPPVRVLPKVVPQVTANVSTVQQASLPSHTTAGESIVSTATITAHPQPQPMIVQTTTVSGEVASESATAPNNIAAITPNLSTTAPMPNPMGQTGPAAVTPTNTNCQQIVAEKFMEDPNVKIFVEQLVSSLASLRNDNNFSTDPTSEGPIITSVTGGVNVSNGHFPPLVPPATPTSDAADSRNYFAPSDAFYQFYRRNELPQSYTQHGCSNDSSGDYASSTQRSRTISEEEMDESTNYNNLQLRRCSRGRSSFNPRGRHEFNWNRHNARGGGERLPLLPHPSGGSRRTVRSRWSPNGADYHRNRPYYVVSREFPREESTGDERTERLRPQNPSEQNMAFSVAVLHHAKAISDMTKNLTTSPHPVPWTDDDNDPRLRSEEQRRSRNPSPPRGSQR